MYCLPYVNRCVALLLLVFFLSSPDASLDFAPWMKQGDRNWELRADREKARAAIECYKKVLEIDPENYEACWKIARSYFFLGDMLDENKRVRNQHKVLGEKGIDYAKKALAINHDGIEAHYYYGLCIAQYSIGISIIKALMKGLGTEYERHIGRAIAIDRHYDSAGPLRAMGRYWYRLPWPKRDLGKSISYLEKSVHLAPLCIRGRVYLAEAYLKSGKKGLAKQQLKQAIALTPDFVREVDAERWRKRAGLLLKKHWKE